MMIRTINYVLLHVKASFATSYHIFHHLFVPEHRLMRMSGEKGCCASVMWIRSKGGSVYGRSVAVVCHGPGSVPAQLGHRRYHRRY